MLCGHSHVQRIVEIDGNIVIVNPGSIGLPAYKDELPAPHVIESGSPHARYTIVHYNDRWTVRLDFRPVRFSKSGGPGTRE